MKSIKILNTTIPVWLILAATVSALSIIGTTFALVTVLSQYNVGYIQIGESKVFTILTTDNTTSPGNLNLSTVTMNPNSITANLNWKDDSGVSRQTPLIMNGLTSFNYPILGALNLTVIGTSQGDWNITITAINSTSTFLNYVDVI